MQNSILHSLRISIHKILVNCRGKTVTQWWRNHLTLEIKVNLTSNETLCHHVPPDKVYRVGHVIFAKIAYPAFTHEETSDKPEQAILQNNRAVFLEASRWGKIQAPYLGNCHTGGDGGNATVECHVESWVGFLTRRRTLVGQLVEFECHLWNS